MTPTPRKGRHTEAARFPQRSTEKREPKDASPSRPVLGL